MADNVNTLFPTYLPIGRLVTLENILNNDLSIRTSFIIRKLMIVTRETQILLYQWRGNHRNTYLQGTEYLN